MLGDPLEPSANTVGHAVLNVMFPFFAPAEPNHDPVVPSITSFPEPRVYHLVPAVCLLIWLVVCFLRKRS